MRLRPYQRDAVDRVREVYDRGIQNAMVVLPTGAGKTVTFSAFIREFLAEYPADANAVALVVAHRTELLEQAQDKYLKADPQETVGIYQGGRRESWARVICASIASLYGDTFNADGTVKRRGRINDLPLSRIKALIIDECHHAIAQSYLDLIETIREHSPDCVLLGVTATPYRTDGGLGQLWNCYLDDDKERALRQSTIAPEDATGAVAIKLSINDGINMGFLVPFSLRSTRIVIDTVDLTKVAVTKKGDFDDGSLAEVMDTVDVRQTVVEKWFEHAGPGTPFAGPAGRPTIIFTAGVQAAIHLSEAFKERGVSVAHVSGQMKKAERKATLAAFERGDFLILINCQVLTEGYDAPHVSCVCICRPTKSPTMFVQQAGRGVRLIGQTIEESIQNGKPDCLLLLFAGAPVDGLMGIPDLSLPIKIDGVDRTEKEQAEKDAEESPLDMEQMVADEMMGDAHRRITIRGVSEYPIDVFGDGKVSWMLINGSRVCVIHPGVAVMVYPSRGGNGHTAIALSGCEFRELARDASEQEAIARAQAYAVLNGTQSYLKPGPWFTNKPATEKQVRELARSISANVDMDRSLGRPDGSLDLSGLPEDLAHTSIAQASAWLAYLHARAAFGTRKATLVEALPTSISAPDRLARMKAAVAESRGERGARG